MIPTPVVLSALLLLTVLGGAPGAAEGSVQWSDGAIEVGVVALAPQQALRLHDGAALRALEPGRIVELRFEVVHEGLEQGFRFPDPGQARKEAVGAPYPVRELRAVAILDDGSSVRGHLTSTVAYLTDADGAVKKVPLRAKLQGAPGERLDQLVHPVRLVLRAAAAPGLRTLALPGGAPRAAVALAMDSLARVELAAADGGVALPAGLAPPFFLAVDEGAGWRVAWPAPSDPALAATLTEAAAAVPDFMDERLGLGAWRGAGDSAYALVRTARRGASTSTRPWRLEVQRWKLGGDGRALLAARGHLVRGLLDHGEPPAFAPDPALWALVHPEDRP